MNIIRMDEVRRANARVWLPEYIAMRDDYILLKTRCADRADIIDGFIADIEKLKFGHRKALNADIEKFKFKITLGFH